MKPKTYYYQDELNDEFSGEKKPTKTIDGNYKYIKNNIFYKILAFIVYRIILTPFAFLLCKIKYGLKIYNKKVLKQYKNKGYFMYANHTQHYIDAFVPSLVSFPKKTYVIVHPDNVSNKFSAPFIEMAGALPIPNTLSATKNFLQAVEKRSVEHNAIMIYPEAHIWPFYTKIRPFTAVSFRYPVKFKDPTFCYTMVYKKRKHRKLPKIEVYIDGPFFPNENLDTKEQEIDLRNQVYFAMCQRSALSNCEYNKFVKVKKTQKNKE